MAKSETYVQNYFFNSVVAKPMYHYSDYLIETMRIINNQIPLINLHIKRLLISMPHLKLPTDSIVAIQEYINFEIRKEKIETAIGRLTISRNKCNVSSEQSGLSSINFNLSIKKTLKIQNKMCDIDLTAFVFPQNNIYLNYKTGNRQLYNLATLSKINVNSFQSLLLDSKEYIIDCENYGIYWIIDNNVYTSSLISGSLLSVSKMAIDKILTNNSMDLQYVYTHYSCLYKAQAVFLANAVNGVIPVSTFGMCHYSTNHPLIELCATQLNNLYVS
ncbi:MAG: aminotransferase class IV [Methylacidiphilales bacterium]|nr:aminotransferase class IV [Candidatus Methylacidiphilales bacterium]